MFKNPYNEYVTMDQFNETMNRIDQKFDVLTDVFLGEFDKVHAKIDKLEERMDRFEGKMDLIITHLGIKSATN